MRQKICSLITLVVLSIGFGSSAHADVPTKPYLTLVDAELVMQAALEKVRAVKAPGGSIAIVDDGGYLVLLRRLDNTMPATPPVATGKARTAAIFKTPTSKFETIITEGRTPMLAVEGFMPMRGGVPLVVDGVVIGAIGVSGAASAAQDEEIALAGAAVLRGQ